ncbi:MAG: hypothetical protein KJ970_01205 [Candidatus Eisenbacteria bacterium]|uniref:IS1634 family transposase n=1 Tax=Eiseniibacteriota bacterium TaxID=2212470 RepID=A0A948RTN3_UNCEI|nr:hypothetical protein [Candidatus Eisenbacteria bacterium]MBU2689519.1 hypothetical protein [Candidatus Eisenbacteria bacterium]
MGRAASAEEYDLDVRCLFYDATNFFTFIDTFNSRSTLAQCGKSKEGRSSLRILGLALLVTGDFEVPLFHYLYPGNHNDPTSFRSVVLELVDRYRLLARAFTILVTYNEKLFQAQIRTIDREVAKRQQKLRQYQHSHEKWLRGKRRGRRPTVASVEKKVSAILRGQHMKDLFVVTVTKAESATPTLRYCFDRTAYKRLQRRRLGKTLLFTDNDHWSDADIVTAYRGQHHVENAFRQMKDMHYVSFRPAHHWTDQKLQVHAFTCVLALMLCALLRCELSRKNIHLSVKRMLETLETIQEIQVLFSSGRGRPRTQPTHSKLDPLAQKIFNALHLGRYLPT